MAAIPRDRILKGSVWLLLPLGLALALYWPTLGQPYFWDDLPHFQWATGRDWLQIWTSVIGLSYYRPITFSVYKLFFDVLPAGTTAPAHVLLVAIHVVNGWLVGALAQLVLSRNLQSRGLNSPVILGFDVPQAAGLLAAVFFICYPFAVLPVAHFAALVHPLVTLFTLGSVVAAVVYLRQGHRRWLVVAIVLAFLAPYVHESGVMAGWIAVAVLVFYDRSRAWRHWRGVVLVTAASSSFLLVWLLVPRSAENVAWIGGQGILASTTFFLQGPSFPAQPLSRLVADQIASGGLGTGPTFAGLPLGVWGSVWAVGASSLVAAGYALWRARMASILGMALVWSCLAALPSIVALPFSYISVSQRLLYPLGPPAALLWVAVCVLVGGRGREPWVRNLATLALALLVLVPSLLYIRREVALHELALRPLEQLAEIAREYPAERHLVVNPVNWVNYKHPWYVLGQEGVSVSADYLDFGQLVRLNSGNDTRLRAETMPAVKTEMEQHYYSTINEANAWDEQTFAARARAFDRVWLTAYGDDAIVTEPVGHVGGGTPAEPTDYLASFEDKVYLVGATLETGGDGAVLILDWKIVAPIPDATIFRHIYGCDGTMLGQGDGAALGGMLPLSQMAPGAQVRDVRTLRLEGSWQQGCQEAGVGLYRPDGTRLEARTLEGQPLESNMVRVPVW